MSCDAIFLRYNSVFVAAQHADQITQIFANAALTTQKDGNGNIIDIYFDVDCICVDEELFRGLVPFMRDGSYFEFCDEMGSLWRWFFYDGTCNSFDAIVLWPKPGAPPELAQQIQAAFAQHLMTE